MRTARGWSLTHVQRSARMSEQGLCSARVPSMMSASLGNAGLVRVVQLLQIPRRRFAAALRLARGARVRKRGWFVALFISLVACSSPQNGATRGTDGGGDDGGRSDGGGGSGGRDDGGGGGRGGRG